MSCSVIKDLYDFVGVTETTGHLIHAPIEVVNVSPRALVIETVHWLHEGKHNRELFVFVASDGAVWREAPDYLAGLLYC